MCYLLCLKKLLNFNCLLYCPVQVFIRITINDALSSFVLPVKRFSRLCVIITTKPDITRYVFDEPEIF